MTKHSQNIIRTTSAAAAGLLLSAACATSAFAGERHSLAFSPEKLANPAEMALLREKVRTVANDACPRYAETRSLQVIAACRRAVANDLVAKINVPAFTAFVEQSEAAAGQDFVASTLGR